VEAYLNLLKERYATMSDSTMVPFRQPETVDDPLTAVLRNGARRLLAQAIEAEADAFLASMRGVQLPDGRDRLVRHGHGPERLVQTGIGAVAVQRVKLRDRGRRAHPFHLCDPAALGSTNAEPRCTAADPLPARGLNGRFPGGARRLVGP
jgi:hypothetical protein